MLQYLVFLGALANLSGVLVYIKSTLKGQTKPNRVSWLMWSIAPLIATVAAISKGFSLSVIPVFMSGFGPLLVLIASFKNKQSYWQLRKLDYACGFLSVLALILWAITRNANLAILFAIFSDGLAALPTLIKGWQYPESESALAFVGGLFNSLTSFVAIRNWVFSELAFPIYLVVVNSLLISFIVFGRKKKASKECKDQKLNETHMA